MKLDKVRRQNSSPSPPPVPTNTITETLQDSSGTIDRDEFLSLPQVSSNPLATRYESD